MNKRLFIIVLPFAIIFSLLAAFLLITPALAQDETPPAEPAPEETPAEETTPLGETLAESAVAVVDESGEAIPLAVESLNSGDPWFTVGTVTYSFTLADCDPDLAGDQGCINPLQKAVDYIKDHGTIPTDGFIHVDAGDLPDQVVTINGADVNLAKLKGIVGHVNPDTLLPDAILSYTINPGSRFTIINKLTGFTLSGFNIDGDSTYTPPPFFLGGVVEIRNCAGNLLLQDLVTHDRFTASSAINIHGHNGAVTLKNIDSSNNAGNGAWIDNSTGTAGVTVIGSSFDDNDYAGLLITTNGAVVLNGVSSSHNSSSDPGLRIQQASSVTISNGVFNGNTAAEGLTIMDLTGNITLTNVTADDNLGGMSITTKGNITFKDVSASNNQQYGADLNTCNGTPCEWLGTGKVTITNGTFNDNTKVASAWPFGLRVQARGAIAVTNVTANGNGHETGPEQQAWGAYLDTSQSQLVSPVTVINGEFSRNYTFDAGLKILAKGVITLNKMYVFNNWNDNWGVAGAASGVILDNTAGTNAGVTIKGSAAWDNYIFLNQLYGLVINTDGPVNIQYLKIRESIDNSGLVINNSTGTGGSVTISHALFYSDYGYAADITTKGSVTLTDIDAYGCKNGSAHIGGILINVLGTAGAVTITGAKLDDAGEGGLLINNLGNVSLTDIYLKDGGNGVKIDNHSGTGNVTIKNISVVTSGNLSGSSIYVRSSGAISLTNAWVDGAAYKGAYGANLDNSEATTAKPVTVSTSTFTNNGNSGLHVHSKGLITVKNVNSVSNSEIDHTIGYDQVAYDAVTPNEIWEYWYFEGTLGDDIGFQIHQKGLYLKLSLTGPGIDPANPSWTTSGGGGVNTIEFNPPVLPGTGTYRLQLEKYANTIAGGYQLRLIKDDTTPVDVSDPIYGIDLDNTAGSAGISITGSTLPADGSGPLDLGLTDNAAGGLRINSHGAVTITNLYASRNGGQGAIITNQDAVGAMAVTVSNMRIFDNMAGGLTATSRGAITLKNAAAWGHSAVPAANGITLDNTIGSAPVSITNLASTPLLEKPGFNLNYGSGLQVTSKGAVTLTNVNAHENGVSGILVDNDQGTSLGGVTLTSCRTNDNGDYGLSVHSLGIITVSGGIVYFNGRAAELHNETVLDTAPKAVTLSNTQFDRNQNNGLQIRSKGAVTLNNVTYSGGNTSNVIAIDIDNSNSISTSPVTLMKVKANDNYNACGVKINSKGAVKITSSEASNNSGWAAGSEGIGFDVTTQGAITLTNVIANWNRDTGVVLKNQTSTTNASVTVSGTNLFSNNGGSGLLVTSKGLVTLSGITTEHNSYLGILVDNYSSGTGIGNVTISKVNTRSNDSIGLMIQSNGTITLSSVVSMLNNHGMEIYSHGKNVLITNSVIAANDGNGIYAQLGTTGNLTLTNTLLFGNSTNLSVTH